VAGSGSPSELAPPLSKRTSKSEIVQPHADLPAVCDAVPENKENPVDDGAEQRGWAWNAFLRKELDRSGNAGAGSSAHRVFWRPPATVI